MFRPKRSEQSHNEMLLPDFYNGVQHFSKLDAKNDYWSIKLDAKSQLLTTFHSLLRRFCFQRMPFGLVMSQEVFIQKMDMILEKRFQHP